MHSILYIPHSFTLPPQTPNCIAKSSFPFVCLFPQWQRGEAAGPFLGQQQQKPSNKGPSAHPTFSQPRIFLATCIPSLQTLSVFFFFSLSLFLLSIYIIVEAPGFTWAFPRASTIRFSPGPQTGWLTQEGGLTMCWAATTSRYSPPLPRHNPSPRRVRAATLAMCGLMLRGDTSPTPPPPAHRFFPKVSAPSLPPTTLPHHLLKALVWLLAFKSLNDRRPGI